MARSFPPAAGSIFTVKYDAEHEMVLPINMPVIVMVNQYSASASEIFSGAMKDLNRGLIVGRA